MAFINIKQFHKQLEFIILFSLSNNNGYVIYSQVSVKSLEDVIMRFLKQGEQRCTDARKEATNALVDIDDLEVLQTPERY